MRVDPERGVAAVRQHPQPAPGVEGQVQGAVGEGESGVRQQPVLTHGEEVKRGRSEDAKKEEPSAGTLAEPRLQKYDRRKTASRSVFLRGAGSDVSAFTRSCCRDITEAFLRKPCLIL